MVKFKYEQGQSLLVYHYRDNKQRHEGIVLDHNDDCVTVEVPVFGKVIEFDPQERVELGDRIDGWGHTVWRIASLDRWIDLVFNEIDDLFIDGKYEEIDAILEKVNVKDTPLTILVGYLTITLPFIQEWTILQGDRVHKSGYVSKAREQLFFKILDRLREDGESERRITRLMGGLGLEYYNG